jgi:hypothetical protein
MHSPSFHQTLLTLRMILALAALLIGGCTGESSAPAPISGQIKGRSEVDGQRSGSQSPRVKSGNIKTH